MKARHRLDNQARQDYYQEIFTTAAEDIISQCLAAVFYTLDIEYGWKSKRLKDFANALHRTNDDMCKQNTFGRRISPIELEKHIKSEYGIDLRKEFPPIVADRE